MNRYLIGRSTLRQGIALALFCFMSVVGWCQGLQPSGPVLLDVERFTVEGENPLSAQETQTLLGRYTGQNRSLSQLEAAAHALEDVLREKGFAFHRVIVPAQRPSGGVVKLQILRFDLNAVTVSGNQSFTRENILRSLPALEIGKSPDVNELARELSLANQHPSKRMSIHIKESQRTDHLDADVSVRDVPDAQAFVGVTGGTRDFDNTINQNTGYTRLTVGYQRSNLFDRDHVLTVAYTTSPEYMNRVSQLGAFYWIPFYGYNTTLGAYWTRSDVDNGSIGIGSNSFDVSGRGEFMGVRLTYALPKLRTVGHDISLAIDNRTFENHIGFVGTSLPASTVGSRPISLRYAVRTEQTRSNFGAYVEYVSNISGGRSNNDDAYTAARVGARQDWEAFRFGADANYGLEAGWALSGRIRAQYSDDPLIPGEQFGIGGATSVRGLREREVAGDRGYFFNVEAHGPELAAGLNPLLFYDQGSRSNVSPVVGIPTHDSASSVGIGMRWAWQKRLEVNADLATVLSGISGGTPQGHKKLHFSLFYRF